MKEIKRYERKFWFREELFNEISFEIQKHLNPYLYKENTAVSHIKSIYFDTHNFDFYSKRIKKYDDSILYRIRWYGVVGSSSLFIELKININSLKVKKRIEVKPERYESFFNDKHFLSVNNLACIFDEYIVTKQDKKSFCFFLSDACKHLQFIEYKRLSFQNSEKATLRITIDEKIRSSILSNENHTDNFLSNSQFPFSILEIKSKDKNHLIIDWLNPLIENGLIVEINKYSKYIHSVASTMNGNIIKPSWLKKIGG